jgi:hypothetical protein
MKIWVMIINPLQLCYISSKQISSTEFEKVWGCYSKNKPNLPQQAATHSQNPRHSTYESHALLAYHEDHSAVNTHTLTLKISRHNKQQVLETSFFTQIRYCICVTPTTRIWVELKFKMFHIQSSISLQVCKDIGITKIKYMSLRTFPTSMSNWKKTKCPQSSLPILIFHIFFIQWNGLLLTYVRRVTCKCATHGC